MPIIGGVIGGGGGGTTDNTTDERIPYKISGVFDNSPLYFDVSENKIVSDVALEVPAGTIKVGETVDLSACTGALIVENRIGSTNSYIITSEFDATGSSAPTYLNLGAESVLNIQNVFDTTLTANPLTFALTGTVVAPSVRQLNTVTFKTGSILTNVRIKFTDNVTSQVLRYIPDKATYDAGTGGITTVSGDNLFDFISNAADTPGVFNLGVSPFIIENGQLVDVEILADSIDVLGEIGGTPYLIADIQDGPYIGIEEGAGGSDTQMQYNNAGVLAGTTGITFSGASLNFTDNIPLRFGLGNDFTIVHNETDTLLVSNTGDIEFYNTDATGLIYFTLGTDTELTSFQVRDNSANPLFEVFGDGALSIGIDPTISINTEGNVDFKNSISTPYLGSGQLQNLLRWSEDTTNVVWTDTPSVLAITADQALAPDGTMTADEWAFSAFVGTGVLQTVVLTNGATYTLSFWARALTTARAIRFDLGDGAVEDVNVEVTDDLKRYSVEIVAGNNDVIYVKNHIATAGTIYVWGFQVNDGVERLPYFKTEAIPINAAGSEAGLVVNGDAIINGFVGIGNSDPQAPLHFETSVANKKIVLGGTGDNDHEFLGFGVSGVSLRYQVDSADSDHTFYAASSPTISNELMRITGDGFVGIGTSTPHAPLQFANSGDNRKIVINEVVDNDHEYYGFGTNPSTLRYQVPATSSRHVFYAGTSATTSDELFRINGDGLVGIGGAVPHAQFQLSNIISNRSIVLWEQTNNDHQFFGLGINSGVFRHQVPSTTIDYVFYAGTSATTSDELFRITGDGFVGIGNSNPHAPLHFESVPANRKVVLYEISDNDHQFFGFGTQASTLRYQVSGITADHVFFAGTSPTTSNELMRISGSGDVAIGTVGSGGRFTFVRSTDDSSSNIYSGSATGSASTVFYNSTPAIIADIIYDETNNNFSISTEAGVDLILATGSGANIGVNKPLPVSTLHISEGTTTSDSTTGTTFEQIGLGSAVTHYVRTDTGTVVSSGIDEDDIYKISNDYALGINTDIAINTEGNIDFKNTIATPYGGFGRLQNLLLWSEDTTNAAWSTTAVLTKTANTVTAPDGTLNADTWAFTATLAIATRQILTLGEGSTYTVSFWARALTTDRIIRFDLGDGLSGDINVLSTDDLQRYSLQLVAGSGNFFDVTNVVASVGSIYVWGFQLNEGTERLPYTRTEAVQVHGTGPESGLAINHSAIFSTIAAPNYSEGTLFYDDGDKALSYYNDDNNVTVGIGRDLLVRVQNDQGVTISSGEAVYINGSSAGLPTVKLARSDSSVTSQFAGIVTETLVLNGEIGYVSTFGLIEFLNTSAWSAGDELYLSSTVAGALTNVPPTSPNHIVSVAHVVTSDLITGSIQVHTPERIAPDELYSSVYSPITAPTHTEGQVYYDTDDKSLSYQTSSDGVTMNIGKEIFVPPQIFNDQGVAITNGQAVYISGSDGTNPKVKLAQANAEATAISVGLITETSIANTALGYCTTYGLVRGFNTVSWAEGDVLYLSPTVAGGLQNTKPVYPNLAIRMGIVILSAASGTIFCTYPIEETTTGSALVYKSHAISDQGAADVVYLAGNYSAPTTSVTLTIGGTVTQTYGTALGAYAAHAFCVASGAGGTDLVLTVTGSSITDAGVYVASDSEIIVADTDAVITNQYFETTKKWLGQITYTLTGTTGAFTFNYGFCKYDDYGNQAFIIEEFEMNFKSGVNATGQNIEILHHKPLNWTYAATGFVPGPSDSVISMATDYSVNTSIFADEYFPYKRSGLSEVVDGAANEGVIIRVTQSTNNSTDFGTAHIGVRI